MFTFEDQGGRSLTLRPEATASICRAYLEHGMQKLAQPVKLWTDGPFFRHERPQAGRYRQFTQVDAEAIGSDSPLVDAEMILLASDILDRARGGGSPAAAGQPRDARRPAPPTSTSSATTCARTRPSSPTRSASRIDVNPLRAFDADHEGTRKVMADAPTLLDRLDAEDAEHFAEVRGAARRSGVAYDLDPTLVRGLDYYTRTVFEFECDRLGAQSGIGGGGRYDGLIEQLGGPPTPGCGWALGVDRIALALEDRRPAEEPDSATGSSSSPGTRTATRALALVTELRRAGIPADLDLAGRATKGQMKQADRVGARYALILAEDGRATLRDMDSGEEREVDPRDRGGNRAS